MRLIGLAVVLAVGLALAPLVAEAQEARKTARIGVLDPSSLAARRELLEAFGQALRERGYMEGQNIVIEHRWAEGRLERLPKLAADLVRLKVDIIVALSAPAAQAAKQATTTIPIVMVGVGDPVEARLVANLSRPGGNITGSSSLAGELSAKRLELLKEVVPGLARVAVLWNSANPAKAVDWREAQVAARTLRVSLQSREVRGPGDFESVFARMTKDRPDALLALGDPLLLQERGRIVEFAARNRLPAMYEHRVYTDAGGLIAYGPDFRELYRRAATYVDKILKGARPADLPVEQPTKFELVINLKTARTLGLTIPPSVLSRADQIIE
jgi:putative ABC transport system substrate-binding protein